MDGTKVADLKKRASEMWTKRTRYDATLRDVYDYVMPMRDVTGLHVPAGRAESDVRVDKLFDATAVKACYRFAGRLQTELTPIFVPFFALEAGPLMVAASGEKSDVVKDRNEQLAMVTKIVAGVLAGSHFHNSSHEMYADLYAGTGAMLVEEGDSNDELVRFLVAPIPEIALEEGPWGSIWHIVWKRSRKLRDVPAMWPKAKFGTQLQQAIKERPDGDVVVTQYTYFDPEKKRWCLKVWSDLCRGEDQPFHLKEYRTCPWLTPRFFKVPGEAYGRGPAQMALPFIKTTNKARELALKAAAFAIMGLWMRRDDGVFNPDTVSFSPMSMWTVGSTGGPLGATIQRLPVPQDFDIASVVIADEREQMKLALFDDTLPPETAAVRSATEIAERMRRLSQDLSGAYGRLTLEIVVPLIKRVIEILENKGLLEGITTIDQMLTQVRVVAPISSGQQAAKVQTAVDWVQTMAMLAGPEAAMLAARMEDLLPQLGRWFGVDEVYIRSEIERKQMMEAAAQQAQQMQQAEMAKANPPPPPEQQIVNGGGF